MINFNAGADEFSLKSAGTFQFKKETDLAHLLHSSAILGFFQKGY